MTDTNDSAVGRLERAIRSHGIHLSGDGDPAQRLAACAAAIGGLGIACEPTVDAVTAALASIGVDAGSAQFDSPEETVERRQRDEAERAEAAAAEAAATAEQARAAARAAEEAAEEHQRLMSEQRLAALERQAEMLAADAETKLAEAATIKERADAAAAELAAAQS
jgi:hypothetical protein